MQNCLDVSKLRGPQTLDTGRTLLAMNSYLAVWEPALSAMADQGRLSSTDSFGFAMLPPLWNDELEEWVCKWDKPYDYTWFAGGWGPDRDRLIANAVRKIRPLLRRDLEFSTLEMVLDSKDDPFQDKVPMQDEDGNFPWGDFGFGGAVRAFYGPLEIVGACSGFSQFEDHLVTGLILGDIAKLLLRGSGMLSP